MRPNQFDNEEERAKEESKNGFGGEVPSALSPPEGCAFGPRCPLAEGNCLKQMPELEKKSDYEGHFVACWKC